MPKYIPYNKALLARARENRKRPTCAEAKFWIEVLRTRELLNYKFHRQKPLLSYIVDFYCPKLRLVVELDGDSHAQQISYDSLGTSHLNAYGICVVRYFNNDVMCNVEGVCENLKEVISGLIKPTPALPYQGGSKNGFPPLSGRE